MSFQWISKEAAGEDVFQYIIGIYLLRYSTGVTMYPGATMSLSDTTLYCEL